MPTVLKNNKGVSLVEVLIALIVSLILFLALMQSALLSISMNTKNVIRDEAINVAEERMRLLRGLPFDEAELQDTAGVFIDDFDKDETVLCNGETRAHNTFCRNFKNFELPFTSEKKIKDIPDTATATAKQIEIRIKWDWEDHTEANGNPYTHTITSIKRG